MLHNYEELVDAAQKISKNQKRLIRVAVAGGHDQAALQALARAQELEIAQPILVGQQEQIEASLQTISANLSDKMTIEPVVHENEIAPRTMRLIRERQAETVMKGKIKTAILLKSVLDKVSGLRTGQLISDVVVVEHPKENRFLLISDGGVNIAPDLMQKVQIIENAVLVAHALGIAVPKVAVLSAIELVNPHLSSTTDAAIITQMNHRGQIANCLIDGPLAFDNAISIEAAQEKGIQSPVAGIADILICPNIESASIFAKSLTFLADLPLAHTCMGAKVPVLIPSRADNAHAKLLSLALSVVVSNYLNG
jgi:phosphate butyryltransferase